MKEKKVFIGGYESMKKWLSIGLILAMSTTLIAGCGKSGSNSVKAENTDVVEIDFWYSGGKTAVGVLGGMVDKFNNSQTKYHINTTTQADYSETYEKLQASIAGKKAPDMALIDVDKARNLSKKNLISDIQPFVDKDSSFEEEDYLPVFYDQGKDSEGKLFALPAYGTTQVFYYNIKAFEEVGVDPATIKTWQDLEAAAKKMTKNDGSFVGWEPMWGKLNLIDAALSNGASLLSEDGKTVTINSEEWVEVWESFRTWIHDDKIMKINYGGQGWEYWYKTIDDVLLNKAGGYTGSSGDQADLDFDKVAAMEQPGWGDSPSAPCAEVLQLIMLEGSTDAEQQGVYEFMKFFSSPENQGKWTMETGYVAVRNSTQEVEEFKTYVEKNPQALVPFTQSTHASIMPEDPTGGKILDALDIACDKVEIEGVSAKEALDEAQKTAQEALESVE